jgi:hypothetical protein
MRLLKMVPLHPPSPARADTELRSRLAKHPQRTQGKERVSGTGGWNKVRLGCLLSCGLVGSHFEQPRYGTY